MIYTNMAMDTCVIRKTYGSLKGSQFISPGDLLYFERIQGRHLKTSKFFFFVVANLGNGQSSASTAPKVS